jgi:hypothetical protein
MVVQRCSSGNVGRLALDAHRLLEIQLQGAASLKSFSGCVFNQD